MYGHACKHWPLEMTEAELSKQLKQLAGMPAAEFVLHRKPMLLLDQLVNIGPDFAICEWRVRQENAFLAPNVGVPAYIGVEYMAQCIAVHAGARERICGFPPPLGLLLGTRHYRAEVGYFDEGVTYSVECRELVRSMEGMGSFDCSILLNGRIIVEGRLAVLQKQRRKESDG
jgi:predicted hotdog family 3-hydroxylacyl-ACP dehydratase